MTFAEFLGKYYGKTWQQWHSLEAADRLPIYHDWLKQRDSLKPFRRDDTFIWGIVALGFGLLVAYVARGLWA